MAKRVVALGLMALIVGPVWGDSPPRKETPAERAKKVVIFFDKEVQCDWGDGEEGEIHISWHLKAPSPSPFPAEASSKPGPFRRAVSGLDHAHKRARNVPEACASDAASRGYRAFQKKEYERSRAEYDEAIRLNPEERAHYSNRAKVRLILGENEQAIEDLTRAIALSPKERARFLVDRGRTWYWMSSPPGR